MNAQPGCSKAGANDGNYDPPFSPTYVSDHSCDTGECKEMKGVEEDCVNRSMQIGTPLGRLSTWNNCQTYAIFILK